jgi:hypothetical protein
MIMLGSKVKSLLKQRSVLQLKSQKREEETLKEKIETLNKNPLLYMVNKKKHSRVLLKVLVELMQMQLTKNI